MPSPRFDFPKYQILDWSLVERSQWIPLNWRAFMVPKEIFGRHLELLACF